MTDEQRELIDKAFARLQQPKGVREIHNWPKNCFLGIATRLNCVDAKTVQAAIDAFKDKVQAAITNESIAAFDRLTKTIIDKGRGNG